MSGKISLCCYSDSKMSISKNKLIESFINLGYKMDDVYSYDENVIKNDTSFYDFNKEVLTKERGSGYWLWKPYIIYNTLKKIKDDDFLLYCDSGVIIINDIELLKNNGDITIFNNEWSHIDWCKMDVLRSMLPNHTFESIIKIKQVQASVFFIKKTEYNLNLIKEWLSWSQINNFIDDSPSKLPNINTYKEHRHDQAIISNLVIREGIKTHWWPTTDDSTFKGFGTNVFFYHHRKRNNEW